MIRKVGLVLGAALLAAGLGGCSYEDREALNTGYHSQNDNVKQTDNPWVYEGWVTLEDGRRVLCLFMNGNAMSCNWEGYNNG